MSDVSHLSPLRAYRAPVTDLKGILLCAFSLRPHSGAERREAGREAVGPWKARGIAQETEGPTVLPLLEEAPRCSLLALLAKLSSFYSCLWTPEASGPPLDGNERVLDTQFLAVLLDSPGVSACWKNGAAWPGCAMQEQHVFLGSAGEPLDQFLPGASRQPAVSPPHVHLGRGGQE